MSILPQPLRTALNRVAARLLPGSCLLCAADSAAGLLCPACAADLPQLPATLCPQCGDQTTLDALDAATWTRDELTAWLAPVSAALLEVRTRAALPIAVTQAADLVEAPGLDVKHKLKLSIPLIPFLLDYEGELEFDAKMNLENAWQALKRLILRR